MDWYTDINKYNKTHNNYLVWSLKKKIIWYGLTSKIKKNWYGLNFLYNKYFLHLLDQSPTYKMICRKFYTISGKDNKCENLRNFKVLWRVKTSFTIFSWTISLLAKK